MKGVTLLCGLFLICMFNKAHGTTRPIIGILTLPTDSRGYTSYFPASYVKWVESGGARVVPIHYESSADEITSLLANLSGALFTGGGASLAPDSTYFKAVEVIYNFTVTRNQMGDFFPLWGTCLGFQSLCRAQSQDPDILSHFEAENITLPLNFTSAVNASRMFRASAPGARTAQAIMATQPVTMNNHHYGVTPDDFHQNERLSSFFDVLSTNNDRNGKTFVSAIEGKTMPIYGVQFHPEKNIFEWWPHEVMQHYGDAVLCMQYLADFFVGQARMCKHSFPSAAAEAKVLIYNTPTVYTNDEFVQCYFWK